MAISRLHLVTINFDKDHYNDVLLKLVGHDNFHPEPASKFTDSVAGLSTYNREDLFEEMVLKLEEASQKFDYPLQEVEVTNHQLNILRTKDYIDTFLEEIDEVSKVRDQLSKILDENEQAMTQLEHVANLNVNFDDLFSSKYLQIRFGKLPLEYVKKLSYYETLPFIFTPFHNDSKYTWCMYITTPANAPEIDNIFCSLYFERIYIPNFVHGEPELAIAEIQEESNIAKEQKELLTKRILAMFEAKKEALNRIYTIVKDLHKGSILQPYIIMMGDKLSVYGFVPKKDSEAFKTSIEEIEGVHVDIKPSNSDARLSPPTLLRNGWFSKPFRMFVTMYGVPNYNDIDPTFFVALSYTLLFGIMFADVGQGLLLSVLGYAAYKLKGMQLGLVGTRIGISSAVFGVLFGSVFGSEEILTPFFHTMDSDNTMILLGATVGLGISLIVISMLFNIFLNMRRKKLGEVLFGHNGLAGLIFYVSLLGVVIDMLLGIGFVNIIYIIALLIIPIVIVFLNEPLTRKLEGKSMFPHGFGGFFIEGFFELFEVVLSFVSNTLSFLRVGGFVFSHAGMMLVVYTLAEMVGGIGYWLVLVIGNIFVMCLEGLVVGIQVLRLEFYEMFSRYYLGNGKPFQSIKEK